MKAPFPFYLTALALLAGTPLSVHAANLRKAVITQKVNKVSLSLSAQAAPQPASTGSIVRDENIVRTGVQSRAELEFEDKTLTRLGANSIFSFDVENSELDFQKGTFLFSKPKGTGSLQIRSAAVTAAITGSTGFVSILPTGKTKGGGGGGCPKEVVMMGMLEGSIKGKTTWCDEKGGSHELRFNVGAGELLVSEPGKRPVVVQFDLPRFVDTSPLIKNFASELPNGSQIARAVAAYRSLESRGFIDQSNAVLARVNNQIMFVSARPVDAGIYQLTAIQDLRNRPAAISAKPETPQLMPVMIASAPPSPSPSGGFVNVGGSGTVRGQLIWQTSADLDLHLNVPLTAVATGQPSEVFFGRRTVILNNGSSASLDQDNLGGVINVPPNSRVENIVVTGAPASGDYSFFVRSFSTPNPSDPCTLLVTGDGGLTTQTLNCNLLRNQNSSPLVVRVP